MQCQWSMVPGRCYKLGNLWLHHQRLPKCLHQSVLLQQLDQREHDDQINCVSILYKINESYKHQ